jgi:ABC-type glucose/galactose transport system permease subunit
MTKKPVVDSELPLDANEQDIPEGVFAMPPGWIQLKYLWNKSKTGSVIYLKVSSIEAIKDDDVSIGLNNTVVFMKSGELYHVVESTEEIFAKMLDATLST